MLHIYRWAYLNSSPPRVDGRITPKRVIIGHHLREWLTHLRPNLRWQLIAESKVTRTKWLRTPEKTRRETSSTPPEYNCTSNELQWSINCSLPFRMNCFKGRLLYLLERKRGSRWVSFCWSSVIQTVDRWRVFLQRRTRYLQQHRRTATPTTSIPTTEHLKALEREMEGKRENKNW